MARPQFRTSIPPGRGRWLSPVTIHCYTDKRRLISICTMVEALREKRDRPSSLTKRRRRPKQAAGKGHCKHQFRTVSKQRNLRPLPGYPWSLKDHEQALLYPCAHVEFLGSAAIRSHPAGSSRSLHVSIAAIHFQLATDTQVLGYFWRQATTRYVRSRSTSQYPRKWVWRV